jgi:hypothetical protein
MNDNIPTVPRFAGGVIGVVLVLTGVCLLVFAAPPSGDSPPSPYAFAAEPDGNASQTRRRVKRKRKAPPAPTQAKQVTTNRAVSDSNADAPRAATTEKIGVPECDDYMDKYEACIKSKIPEKSLATFTEAFAATRKGWLDAAATPQGRVGLAQACKEAHKQARISLRSYGCSW